MFIIKDSNIKDSFDVAEFDKKKLTNIPGAMMNIAKALVGSGCLFFFFFLKKH
jgi:hypothetical protein